MLFKLAICEVNFSFRMLFAINFVIFIVKFINSLCICIIFYFSCHAHNGNA